MIGEKHIWGRMVGPLIPLVVFLACAEQMEGIADEPQTSFARRQLEQMCEDRPDMSGILAVDDPVYKRIEGYLDIGDPTLRIYWVPLEPRAGFLAEHNPKNSEFPAHVRLTSDPGLSGEDRWIILVYELHNMDNSDKFHKLYNSLLSDNLTANQFADEFLLLELAAEVQTKLFLSRYVPPTHSLARSKFYELYKARPDKAPTQISRADRERCKANLALYRKWALDGITGRPLYQRK